MGGREFDRFAIDGTYWKLVSSNVTRLQSIRIARDSSERRPLHYKYSDTRPHFILSELEELSENL